MSAVLDRRQSSRRSLYTWLHLGLTPRIVLGVSIGVALVFLVTGLVAVAALSRAVDAAGREQVILAESIAARVSTAYQADSPTSNQFSELVSASMPADLQIQVITVTGTTIFETAGTSRHWTAEHVGLLRPLIAAGQSGYRIHQEGSGEGFISHIVAYAPVPRGAALGVIVQQSQSTILAAPDQVARQLLAAGLLGVALAVGVAWLDVRRVIRPLQLLTTAADRFASGQLTEPIAVDRADEIGSLAASFETMRQRLSQSLREIEGLNQELERRVEQRTSELERRNRQLAAINAVAEVLTDPLNLTTLLERTLERISDGTGFEVANYRLSVADQTLPVAATRGLPVVLLDETIELGHCLCGRAAQQARCQFANNLADEVEAGVCRESGIASAVAVPLISNDRVEGILFLGSRQERRVEPGEIETLAAIGRQVGMAVANARLYQALQQRHQERAQLLQQVMTAQEEERRSLAAELHDDVSQTLASVLLAVESLPRADEPGSAHGQRIREVLDLISTTLDNVHGLAAELRPSILDDVGLVAALDRLVGEFRSRSPAQVEFQTVAIDGLRFLPAVETALFRIAQAALSNIERHAAASVVGVLLQRRGNRVILVVEDDGQGFDLPAVRRAPLKDRLGLAGLEERAQLIGARTTIESAPGRGTTIFIDLPLAENLSREPAGA